METAKASDINQCVDVLLAGEIAVMPTDTVYGVVCKADNRLAVAKLYALKKRQNKPGTIIAGSIDQLVDLGIKRRFLTAVEQFWPNPISVAIPNDLTYLNLQTGRQACRVVDDEALINFLKKTGPLLTTSANLPGEPTATNVQEARDYFGENVNFYLDGGELTSEPSTLVSIEDDAIRIIRQGSIKINERGDIEK